MLLNMDRTTLTLTVELELDDEAFSGRASDDLGASRQFTGWLGLIASIDDIIGTATARSREQRSDERGTETP
jgi:hypothetical protein